MTLYPDVQKKAQAELDAVVGMKRLPAFEDRPSLPYCEAMFTELLRWNSPAPICAPSDLSFALDSELKYHSTSPVSGPPG